jgi:hypothetical protein
MAGPGDDPEPDSVKLDRILAQLTTITRRLDTHDKRIARTEKFQRGEEDDAKKPDDDDPKRPDDVPPKGPGGGSSRGGGGPPDGGFPGGGGGRDDGFFRGHGGLANRSSRSPASTANPIPCPG